MFECNNDVENKNVTYDGRSATDDQMVEVEKGRLMREHQGMIETGTGLSWELPDDWVITATGSREIGSEDDEIFEEDEGCKSS